MSASNRLSKEEAADGAGGTDASIEVRVRYHECDPMNLAHHSMHAVWFEMARTELLRHHGISYREVEAAGVYLVVARLNVRFRKPAHYDDCLTIEVTERPNGGVKLEHTYTIHRGDELLATGETTLVCVDGNGRPQQVPGWLTEGAG